MVSCVVFRSLGHFEFIFMDGVRECCNFIDRNSCPVFLTLLAEEAVFSQLYILAFFVSLDELTIGMWVYFWIVYSILLIFMCVFVLILCYFGYCGFVVYSEIW